MILCAVHAFGGVAFSVLVPVGPISSPYTESGRIERESKSIQYIHSTKAVVF